MAPIKPKPASSMAKVSGSGTAETMVPPRVVTEITALVPGIAALVIPLTVTDSGLRPLKLKPLLRGSLNVADQVPLLSRAATVGPPAMLKLKDVSWGPRPLAVRISLLVASGVTVKYLVKLSLATAEKDSAVEALAAAPDASAKEIRES